MQGIIEDLDSFDVCPDVASVLIFKSRRIGIACQTTMPPDLVSEIHAAIVRQNPEARIRFANTICQPTLDRQRALDRLLDQVDALVVVGGRNSNNTRRLADRARARGVPTLHIETASEIHGDWFRGRKVVGLTAGTSTPDAVIESVYDVLVRLEPEGSQS